ncbi:cytochrome P450-dit2 [Irineochytrium annulatum]|nr:cytochrome P450-dit2 [Irineochytrium annulatum]
MTNAISTLTVPLVLRTTAVLATAYVVVRHIVYGFLLPPWNCPRDVPIVPLWVSLLPFVKDGDGRPKHGQDEIYNKHIRPRMSPRGVASLFFGGRWNVAISHPAHARILFTSSSQFIKSGNNEKIPHSVMAYYLGENVIASRGDAWRRFRSVLNGPLKGRGRWETEVFGEAVDGFMGHVEGQVGKSGGRFVVGDLMQRFCMDAISVAAFGRSLNALQDPTISQFFLAVKRGIFNPLYLFFPILDHFPIPSRIRLRRQIDELYHRLLSAVAGKDERVKRLRLLESAHEIEAGWVNERKVLAEEGNEEEEEKVGKGMEERTLIGEMLTAVENGEWSLRDFRHNFMILLIAGHENPQQALTSALHLLALNPHIQHLARAEILSLSHASTNPHWFPTTADLEKLPYLRAVFKETLRMLPPIPMLANRRATEDVVLQPIDGDDGAGIVIPKGVYVAWHAYGLHHNDRVWTDCDAFRPERFLSGEMSNDKMEDDPFSFIGFAGGARQCLGQRLAAAECMTFLAVMLRRYRWRCVEGRVAKMTPAGVLSPVGLELMVERVVDLEDLWVSYFVSNFDGVFAAMSAMQKDLKCNASQVAWTLNALSIVSTAFFPLWARLAHAFGNRACYIASSVLFVVGVAGAAASPSLAVLCFFRGVQGIGSSGFSALALVVFTNRLPRIYRAAGINSLGVGMALAMIGGPIVGGQLTDQYNWRWVFYILLPLSAVFIPSILLLDNENRDSSAPLGELLKKVDYLGSFLLLATTGCLLLAVTFGHTDKNWSEPSVIVLFVMTVVFLGSFVANEIYLAKQPIMPMDHFRSRSVVVSSALNFLTGGTSMAFMMYVPMFYRMAKSATALMSEVDFIPYNLAWTLFTVPAVLILSRVRPNHVVTFGCALLAIGSGLFAQAVGESLPNTAAAFTYMAIAGAGAAFANQNSVLCAQADLRASLGDVAIVGNVPVYFHRIGGSVLIQALSVVFDGALGGSGMAGMIGVAGASGKNGTMTMGMGMPTATLTGEMTAAPTATMAMTMAAKAMSGMDPTSTMAGMGSNSTMGGSEMGNGTSSGGSMGGMHMAMGNTAAAARAVFLYAMAFALAAFLLSFALRNAPKTGEEAELEREEDVKPVVAAEQEA